MILLSMASRLIRAKRWGSLNNDEAYGSNRGVFDHPVNLQTEDQSLGEAEPPVWLFGGV